MVLPYETMNADQRLAERMARKQWLDELPKSSNKQSFFKEVMAGLVEANELVEDSFTGCGSGCGSGRRGRTGSQVHNG